MADLHDVPALEVLAGIADAVIYSGRDGIIRLWNDGATAVFGFSDKDAIGQSLDLIIPEKLRPAHWRGFDAAIERGATIGGRRTRLTKGLHKEPDRPLYVEMSFAVVTTSDGSVAGSVAIARDVTERQLKAREDRKRTAQAQSASHESAS